MITLKMPFPVKNINGGEGRQYVVVSRKKTANVCTQNSNHHALPVQ